MRNLSTFSPIMREEILNISVDIVKEEIDYSMFSDNSNLELGIYLRVIFNDAVSETAHDFEKAMRFQAMEVNERLIDSNWLKNKGDK